MKLNKPEQLKDNLWVRKQKDGTYEVVYPLKIDETKGLFAKDNLNKRNLKIVAKKEILNAISLLIPFISLWLILGPGAQQLKEQCQDNINYLIENSCKICSSAEGNGYGDLLTNFSLNTTSSGNIVEGMKNETRTVN